MDHRPHPRIPAPILFLLALACATSHSRPSEPADPPVDPFVERQISAAQTDEVGRVVEANNRFATERRILDLFPAGSIARSSRLVLANAIYFKGSRQRRFAPDSTRNSDFVAPGNQIESVPMMRMTATFPFAQPPGLSVLALPYAGKDLEMVLLLPNETAGVGTLEATVATRRPVGAVRPPSRPVRG